MPSLLPVASTGVSYSAALVNGGTPPYVVAPFQGSVPGLTAPAGAQNDLIVGTPTTPGVFQITPAYADQWGNNISSTVTVQVISPATLSSVVPNQIPAGSGLMTIAVNGSNFVDPETPPAAAWCSGR